MPERSFVLGFFELDAHGSFHSPRIPRVPLERMRAESRGDYRPSPGLDREVSQLEAIVRRGLGEPADSRLDIAQAPGTTRKKQVDATAHLELALADEIEEEDGVDAYKALSRLNRAGKERRAKLQKSARAEQYAGRSAEARSRGVGRFAALSSPVPAPRVQEGATSDSAFRESDDASLDAFLEPPAAPEASLASLPLIALTVKV